MIKKIILIIIIFWLTEISAKNYVSKTDYFIAKKLFNNKEYTKSEFILKKIISENNINDKYNTKAKILKTLIEYKKNNIDAAQNTIKTINKVNKQNHYYNKILYLKSIIYYNCNNNFIQNFFGIYKDTHEQTMQYKSLTALQKIKNDKIYYKKIKENINLIKKEINAHKMNICMFYLKKKAYIAVINRLENKNFDLKIKRKEDYHEIYLILKSYNELLLDKLSEKILNKLKKYGKI